MRDTAGEVEADLVEWLAEAGTKYASSLEVTNSTGNVVDNVFGAEVHPRFVLNANGRIQWGTGLAAVTEHIIPFVTLDGTRKVFSLEGVSSLKNSIALVHIGGEVGSVDQVTTSISMVGMENTLVFIDEVVPEEIGRL